MRAAAAPDPQHFGSVILKGQRGILSRLLRYGFVFEYPEIREALREAIEKPG